MGGSGSGGWNRKYCCTIDDTIRLEISECKKTGLLNPGTVQTLTWSVNGIIQLQLSIKNECGVLDIRDATFTGENYKDAYRQKVELIEREINNSSSFRLFKCPCCEKPRRHLYLSGFFLICRTCARLTYKSQRENSDARLIRNWKKVSQKLGGINFDEHWVMRKPKGMHAKTFEHLREQISSLEQKIEHRLEAIL